MARSTAPIKLEKKSRVGTVVQFADTEAQAVKLEFDGFSRVSNEASAEQKPKPADPK